MRVSVHHIYVRRIALALALAVPALAMSHAPATPSPCDAAPSGSAGPSRGLYCIDLIPTPGLGGIAATAALGQARSPFGAAVTVDGHQRYALTITAGGLPDPASLGDYRAYVAWVAPPTLSPMTRLGEIRNGRTALGEIALNKFMIFVSAERSGDVTERAGRLVLRGLSPSTRLDAHGALALPPTRPGAEGGSDAGTVPVAMPAAAPDAHAAHAHGTGAARWTMPPLGSYTPMIQSLHDLVPDATPYLPGAGVDPATIPEARPRDVVTLADGDTLSLDAGLVRRTIGGRTLTMYGFNGQYPGPLLRVAERASVTVRFTNRTEWPTAVHWHGIRLDNRFDGVPGLTQEPVPPGGRFTYQVRFPDAGIYWYHPHHREDVLQDLGLYGNIVVDPSQRGYYTPVHREETLLLDDLLLGDAGPVPYGLEAATHALMGRFGNVLLVNGEPDYRLRVQRGEVVRFFVTNVASTRTWNLSFAGARMKLVGSDVGRFEREEWVGSVVIAPAERYVIEVRFDRPGTTRLENRVQAIDHVTGTFIAEVDTLARVDVDPAPAAADRGAGFERLREHAAVHSEIDPYRAWLDRPADRELRLTLETRRLAFPLVQLLRLDTAYVHPVEWSGTMPMMDWLPTSREVRWVLRDPATGLANDAIDWRFRRGQIVKVRLVNDRHTLHPMAHPIHLHGQRFLVLSRNGVPGDNLAWKDTALVPVGSTVELLVEMSNPGKWMIHCHVAEHLSAGMQAVFTVD